MKYIMIFLYAGFGLMVAQDWRVIGIVKHYISRCLPKGVIRNLYFKIFNCSRCASFQLYFFSMVWGQGIEKALLHASLCVVFTLILFDIQTRLEWKRINKK